MSHFLLTLKQKGKNQTISPPAPYPKNHSPPKPTLVRRELTTEKTFFSLLFYFHRQFAWMMSHLFFPFAFCTVSLVLQGVFAR